MTITDPAYIAAFADGSTDSLSTSSENASWTNLSFDFLAQQPVGMRFYHGRIPNAQNEGDLAAQLVDFMQQFLQVFSELRVKGKKLYLTGESGGIVIPEITCLYVLTFYKYLNHFLSLFCPRHAVIVFKARKFSWTGFTASTESLDKSRLLKVSDQFLRLQVMTQVSRSDLNAALQAQARSHATSSQAVANSTSARQRTRAQTAAFLLGIHPNLPSVNDGDCNRINTVQHFYQGFEITDHSKVMVETATAQRYQASELEKVEFRVLLHTLDKIQSITYVDRLHSKSDSRQDIFDSIKATMDVPELYEHLGWRLSTAHRLDPPHWLLTAHDIDSAFKAVREENSGSGRRTKKVVIEIVNTGHVIFDTCEWFAGHDHCKQKQSSRLLYSKEFDNVKNKLRCLEHPGDNIFCWVDATQPNALHYPLCTQDLQEWAKYLHQTQDPDNACVTPPSTLHFDKMWKSRKARSTLSLQRVPTEVMFPIRIHNHIHLSSAANDTVISDGTLSRRQGHPTTPPPPLKRTYTLYMESDDESSDDEPPQDIEDVLTSAHSRYPTMNFP
ncbi:hypothetical protein EV702DRAFT_1198955 [Suillus placidus]|uniref:Uncharacterized protein n=1 Tax=Suillus placidus TaxID=48579 RepID=A0A9P7D0J8_9AGAM|nr:hypothetical protein EV702DRAFT_1198955 [Suillus placidus]